MKLFHWNRCESLRNYACGDIIVVADTVEEARQRVIDKVKEGFREKYSWYFNDDGSFFFAAGDSDETYQEELENFTNQVKEDISIDPEVKDVVFIQGSD
jgi:hypothetical protein